MLTVAPGDSPVHTNSHWSHKPLKGQAMPLEIVTVPHDGARKLQHVGEPDGSLATVITTNFIFVVTHAGVLKDGQRKFSPVEESLPKAILNKMKQVRGGVADQYDTSYEGTLEDGHGDLDLYKLAARGYTSSYRPSPRETTKRPRSYLPRGASFF